MTETVMDRVLFGDNQFFGVNHMSEEKAREQAVRFRDSSAIVATLDIALDEGIRTLMCTTHERMAVFAIGRHDGIVESESRHRTDSDRFFSDI